MVDSSTAINTCIVEGRVLDQNNMALPFGTIATMNRSVSVRTDSLGFYSMKISSTDSAIFFYHPQHGEVVIWRYNFKSQHRVTINFYPSTYESHQNVKKPVIYLYDSLARNYSIRVENTNVTYLYPKYSIAWQMKSSANGQLIDLSSNKTYPYLFWEGERKDLCYQKVNNLIYGNLVTSDSLISFLENSLELFGLNTKERVDFITYWVPLLLNSQSTFIQFILDDVYCSEVASLNINPVPDCQRRVFMLYTPVDNNFVPFEFEKQEFFGFNRKGATLIEWGGSEIQFLTNPD